MVPTEVLAEQHFSAVRALLGDLEGPGGMAGGEVRVELLTSRVKGKARAAVLDGPGRRARSAWSWAPTRCSPRRSRSRSLGVRGDRRAAPLRRRAAGDAARQGRRRRPRPPGDDGDADPAHGRHGDLRRPRPDHARRAAPGPRAGHDRVAARRGPRAARSAPGPRVRAEVAAGHRAFVVCPLVGGSLRVEAKSATEEYERLAAGELAGLRVGLLHGQMAPAAREEVMDRFRAGELEVLVATTVIEVGRRRARGDRDGRSRAPTASGSPSCTSCAAGSAGARDAELVLPARRRGGQRAPGRGGGLDRRVRPGRGGPAAARRGDAARGAPEGRRATCAWPR